MKVTHVLSVMQVPLGVLSAQAPSRILQPWTYPPLPLGAIEPRGWLHGEMTDIADGLFGHEYEMYPFVNQSSWLLPRGQNGTEYSKINEGLPYWFNSMVPLAFTLKSHALQEQVATVARRVLDLQGLDGWIGPEDVGRRNFWARFPFFLGLTQLAEVDRRWEGDIVNSLRRFMFLANEMLKDNGQGFSSCSEDLECEWAQARVHDMIITIQWLLDRPHLVAHDADFLRILWENMDMFYGQSSIKWDVWYNNETYPQVVNPHNDSILPFIHGVNVGQGLKASAVIYRINGTQSLVQKSYDAVDLSFKYHGSASGTILADERQNGLAPYMGAELCAAVETSYSLAYLYQVLGRNDLADRAERTIFNAFSVMFTANKWAHQYLDQPNQPWALTMTDEHGHVPHVFTTANTGVATTFGMEPQYPCCTVNHGQGYPKFLSNSWVSVGAKGVAHVLLGPSEMSTVVDGSHVSIRCDTMYPFSMNFVYSIDAETGFEFYFRVPDWASGYVAEVTQLSSDAQGKTAPKTSPTRLGEQQRHGLVKFPLQNAKYQIRISLDTAVRTESRSNNTVSVFYGNTLYALDVGYDATSTPAHNYTDPLGPPMSGFPPAARDYFVRNTKPWNVAIDPRSIQYHGSAAGATATTGEQLWEGPIFEPGLTPTHMTVWGCEIDWPLRMGMTPDWAPAQPRCVGGKKQYRLIPYGSARLHMSELPVVDVDDLT
ncbi:hypothetical protein E4U21_006970 [Claviceps maximensis]|nr:hypothetical protein E4U21_006970 [Claviceps maximensis]